MAGGLPASRKRSELRLAADIPLAIPLLSPTGTDEGPTSPARPVQRAGATSTDVPALPRRPQPSSRDGTFVALGGFRAASEPANERATATALDPEIFAGCGVSAQQPAAAQRRRHWGWGGGPAAVSPLSKAEVEHLVRSLPEGASGYSLRLAAGVSGDVASGESSAVGGRSRLRGAPHKYLYAYLKGLLLQFMPQRTLFDLVALFKSGPQHWVARPHSSLPK